MRSYAVSSFVRPEEHSPAIRRPLASNAPGATILGIQRSLGNRAAIRHIAALQIQRDDAPDPQDGTDLYPPHKDPTTAQGGPVDTGDKSLQCGMVNGQFKCGLDIGKGDSFQTPGSLPGTGTDPKASPVDSKKAATCPGQYAWAFNQCCPTGTHVSDNGGICVKDPLPDLKVPPATPDQMGDFDYQPPADGQQYA